MLIAGRPDRRHREPELRRTHCSEAVAYAQDRRAHRIGASGATGPRLAFAWLLNRVRDVADQLDAASAQPARHWFADHREHDRALHLLLQGEMYAFSLFDDHVHYVVLARPLDRPPGLGAEVTGSPAPGGGDGR